MMSILYLQSFEEISNLLNFKFFWDFFNIANPADTIFRLGPIPASFYFRPFLITISTIQIEKSIDGVLGIRTRGHMMVGADDTTELWWLPIYFIVE